MSTKIGLRPLALASAVALIATGVVAVPAAAAEGDASPVRITEFQYNGSEFVEFTNLGATPVDLAEGAGWSFADSGTTAGAVSLAALGVVAPGESFLLAEDAAATFRAQWGLPASVKVAGGNAVNLGRGDTVKLFDGAGALVDQLVYGDNVTGVGGPRTDTASAWPNDETVLGANTVANWTKSTVDDAEGSWLSLGGFPGSPGTSRFSASPLDLPVWDEPEPPASPAALRINEVDSQPSDWVEFYNPGTEALDISGYEIRDNSDDHRWRFAAGTSIAAGAFLVVDANTLGGGWNDSTSAWEENVAFSTPIGVGGADQIRLYDATGALIDETYAWSDHAAVGTDAAGYTLAREVDGVGGFLLAAISKGASNAGTVRPPAVAVNEINSNGGPHDYVEVVNTSGAAIDLTGWYVNDDSARTAAEVTPLAAGTTLAAGARFVFEETVHFAFGLGNGDAGRVFTGAGTLVDEHAYPAHAADNGVWSACPEGGDDFVQTARTPGAANACDGGGEEPTDPGSEYDPAPWPGGAEVTVLDTATTFLEDSSGLDTWTDETGTYLYAVDNGTGRFWKLRVAADGSFAFADGWADGKRVRFQKDAANAAAAGPDAEGITADGDGFVYVASERDNSAKDINQDVILKVDPDAAGPDLVALAEWDVTAMISAVGANLGIEAVEWVSDADLTGALWDTALGKAYDPADYPGHGDGLFFVAVEDGGSVHAFALSDGAATEVAEFTPGLTGVMALDWDTVRGGLWTVCDDGCGDVAAFVEPNGTATPGVTFFARPANAPVDNAEGFATAPAALTAGGVRPAWWFTDGVQPGALRSGTLPGPTGPQEFAAAPLPTVSGEARVGAVLTADAGAWTPAPATLAWQWLRDGAPIQGATAGTYTVSAADLGHALSAKVTATLDGYVTTERTSAAAGAVAPAELTVGRPSVSGTVKVTQTVTAKPGTWTA
ncbi:lamin tail domain-containing protein, partial [Microbacterium rhizophilus]|uniref:lamin tail domain-containing protein n=1 Tax=Microbacterium rhizophilus TaxID=3138934 RepID=UPI0031E6D979